MNKNCKTTDELQKNYDRMFYDKTNNDLNNSITWKMVFLIIFKSHNSGSIKD